MPKEECIEDILEAKDNEINQLIRKIVFQKNVFRKKRNYDIQKKHCRKIKELNLMKNKQDTDSGDKIDKGMNIEQLIEAGQKANIEVVNTKREMETLKKELEMQNLLSSQARKTFEIYKRPIEAKD